LRTMQYGGVALVILGCVGLSYSPPDAASPVKGKRWIPLAVGALLVWGLAQTTAKHAYGIAGSSEVNMSLFNTIGGALTLGLYGLLRDKGGHHSLANWGKSFLPMAMMAGGDLGVIIATSSGPISLVTPISSAYPVVTILFASYALKEKITPLQYACIMLVILGMFLAP
ncbi:MAG: DMT family transporter, partial [Elusimicrobiota bacterium]